jgi:hypothetical protein
LAIKQVPKEQEVVHGATSNLDAGKTPCFAREGDRVLRRNMCGESVNKVKTVRIALCTFRTTTSSPDARPTEFILKCLPTTTCESCRSRKSKSGGSDFTFWQSIRPKVLSGSLLPVAAFRCACFFAKSEAASLLAVKFSSSGEVGFTPLLHRNFTCYFTLDRARHYGNQSDESSRRTKLCAAQTAPEAGATPPFDAQCVTVPAWSLPPSRELRGRVLRGCIHRPENLSDRKSDILHEGERRSPLSILKSPPKQPKAVAIQARVEESVKTQLELYAEFIDASPSYVITEALKLLFRKDDDFRRWTDQHTNNHNNEKAKGDVLAKAV